MGENIVIDTATSLDVVEDKKRVGMASFEAWLLAKPQVDIPLSHYFADGIYGRAMMLAAGVAFTGRVHKLRHLCILAQGTMVLTSTTSEPEEITAPHIFVAPPNTKRAGYAVTDCVFINVLPTNETDVETIENEFTSLDYVNLIGVQ